MELQKHYVENAHEAIIPRKVFYKVQEELHQQAKYIRNPANQRASIVENITYPRLLFTRNVAVSTADKSGLSTEKSKIAENYGKANTAASPTERR